MDNRGVKTTPKTKKNSTSNDEPVTEKKKVKSKDPIKLDLIACIQEKVRIFSSHWDNKIVFSRQFVDMLNLFIGCQQYLSKNTIFIM